MNKEKNDKKKNSFLISFQINKINIFIKLKNKITLHYKVII